MGHRLKDLIVELEIGTNVDIRALVLRRIAVPGRREDGDTSAVVLDFVTLHTDLMRPDNSLKAVVLAEALGDIRAELQTDATLARSTARLWLRVSPEHLHHQTLLAGLPLVVAVEFPDVVQCDLVV